ncbi:MAG: type II toxin-antitoxin system HicA family toxin [Oscillospiraceae bacterium]|nr:type II toxin-antitoxin system HicA family toxin [Oscillospiraceae bacterium]
MKRRDLVKALEDAGYRLTRDDGDHTIYAKQGCRPVQVPRHREINEYTAKAILRTVGLK